MFINYGDTNFLEHGVLVDSEHSDTEFEMLRAEPYSDVEDQWQFARLSVDITDSWIDRKAVMDYIGMTEESFDPIQFAIGCTDYYSWENYGADDYGTSYDWRHVDKETIYSVLRNELIASDNLKMPWLDSKDED